MNGRINLRLAINAISDVIQNRPRPLRQFDQIYMKAGDMVVQSDLVAKWGDGRRLAFIGDGDSIGVCVAYLQARDVIDYGPTLIKVYDFDERIIGAVKRFADRERLSSLDAELYNCIDPLPQEPHYDCFYTNPPWGASNNGESVNLFVQRGMETIRFSGEGMIVIADDPELDWPQQVLSSVQAFASLNGFFVSEMMPRIHTYHLDDNPELRSCNLVIRSLPGNERNFASEPAPPSRLAHFYGLDQQPTVRYVREKKRLDYGKALDDEYEFEFIEGNP